MNGHCLCNAIEYSFDGEPTWTLHCHCETCRRATSAPITTWCSVSRAAFRLLRGQPTYYASSPGARRAFCGRCGSPLFYESDSTPDEVHLLAGTLATPEAVRPLGHVFTIDQLPWFDSADPLPRYEKTRRDGPPTRHGPRVSGPR